MIHWPPTPILAVTVQQPYALFLALMLKELETRPRYTKHRGLLAIHAGKADGPLNDFLEACENYGGLSTAPALVRYGEAALRQALGRPFTREDFVLGHVIAVGTLTDVYRTEDLEISDQERAFGNFDEGRWAWKIADVELLDNPIPARGQQILWPWSHPMVKQQEPASIQLPPFTPGKLKFFDEPEPELDGWGDPITDEDSNEPRINLALLMLPDNSRLATASAIERQEALSQSNVSPETFKPMTMTRILIASMNPVKIAAVEAAFAQILPGPAYNFIGVNAPSGVSDQPMSYAETRKGAENRARAAMDLQPGYDVAVGIEGGLQDGPDGMQSFAWVCAFNGEKTYFAQTAVFYLPDEVAKLVREGRELGQADDEVFGQSNSKQANGAIGLLTGDVITRTDYYTQAVIMALMPFKNEALTWITPQGPRDLLLDLAQSLAAEEQRKAVDEFLSAYGERMACREMVKQAVLARRTMTETEANRDLDAKEFFAKASETLADLIRKGSVVLQGEDPARATDTLIQRLRSDTKLQSNMIQIKNDQVMQLTSDLRKANERVAQLDGPLVADLQASLKYEVQRNVELSQERDAAVTQLLRLREGVLLSTPLREGYFKSTRLTDPTDDQIDALRNDNWEKVFEEWNPAGFKEDGKHFMRFEKVIPFPSPEREEDEAQAAAEAAMQDEDEQPELMPERMHQALFGSPLTATQNARFPIADRLREPGGADALKQEGNQAAAALAVNAATESMN